LPALPLQAALGPGAVGTFSHAPGGPGWSLFVGCAALSAAQTTVAVRVLDPNRHEIARRSILVAPFSQAQIALDEAMDDGEIVVEVVESDAEGLVFPYVLAVDKETGAPEHRLPDGALDPHPGSGRTLKLPRVLPLDLTGAMK